MKTTTQDDSKGTPTHGSRFSAMSKEAQQVAVDMVEYCIRHGIGMGMDEGLRRDGRSRSFRKHLEAFSAQASKGSIIP